jgi:hypothetical protein
VGEDERKQTHLARRGLHGAAAYPPSCLVTEPAPPAPARERPRDPAIAREGGRSRLSPGGAR